MPLRAYRDLILLADDVHTDGHSQLRCFTVRVIDCPVGQGVNKETVSVPGDLRLRCSELRNRLLDQDVKAQIELGLTLADLILPGYARGLYRRSLDRLAPDEGLRLRLHLARELVDLPWEFAYIQRTHGEHVENDFLLLDPRLSIVRDEPLDTAPGDWSEPPDRRRIVVAMASPQDMTRLANLVREQKALRAALDGAPDGAPGVEVVYLPGLYEDEAADPLPGATVEDLATALMDRTDVLHFSGHGEFAKGVGPVLDTYTGKGGLYFAGEANEPELLPAARLAEMLRSKGVRLAVLGACETAERDIFSWWSGVAPNLLREGIPAVLAMQSTIHDRLAAAFMGAFYRALVAGYLVDEAVALGRAAIRRESLRHNGLNRPDMRDWGVPVLYLRASGGRLFTPVADDSARSQAEARMHTLIAQSARVLTPDAVMVGAIDTASARIDLKVLEEAHGVMIGGIWREQPPGRHEILMAVDTLSGTALGAGIGEPDKIADTLRSLQNLTRPASAAPSETANAPPAGSSPAGADGPTCPHCGSPVEADWNGCAYCGTALRV